MTARTTGGRTRGPAIFYGVLVPDPIRVLVADDDPLVREAYRAFLGRRPALELVGEATDGEQATRAYTRLRPDIVLMDLSMPGTDGIEATRAIVGEDPQARILVLTTFATEAMIVPALRAGAAGYVLKDVTADGLEKAIYQALAGEMPLAAPVRRALVQAVADDPPGQPVPDISLTERETEVLAGLAQGLTNAAIAHGMFVSEGSVKQYLSRLAGKLGVRSRTQVLVRAIELGLVDPRSTAL